MELVQTPAATSWRQRRSDEITKTPADSGEPSAPLQTTGDEMTAKPWLSDPGFEGVGTMSEYISIKKLESIMLLELMKIEFEAFRQELKTSFPELSTTDINFTLGPDNRLMLLDPFNKISPEVKIPLTEALNNSRRLREMVQHHATSAIWLSGVQTENAPPQRLSENDIHKAINYGEIVRSSDMSQAWDRQVHRYFASGTPARIDIKA